MRIKKNHWITAGCLAGVLLAFGLGVWLPETRKQAEYRERIDAAQETLGPNFNQPAALASRVQEVEALEEHVGSSRRIIAAQPDVADLLRSLSEAGRDLDIRDQDLNTQPDRHHKHCSEIPVELGFSGSFNAIYSLLEKVETMPRLVRADALSLRLPGRDDPTASPQIRATLRLTGFYTDRPEVQP